MQDIFQTIWKENQYYVMGKNKQKYEEIMELMRDQRFEEVYLSLKDLYENKDEDDDDDDLDNYKEAAQEIWNFFKNKERDNSHFFASLNNQNENLRLLWKLNLEYEPVYLLNSRIFMKEPVWDKAWIIKSNKIKLYIWQNDKIFKIKIPEKLVEKVRNTQNIEDYTAKELDLMRKALFVFTVDGTEIFNPKIAFAFNNGLELE